MIFWTEGVIPKDGVGEGLYENVSVPNVRTVAVKLDVRGDVAAKYSPDRGLYMADDAVVVAIEDFETDEVYEAAYLGKGVWKPPIRVGDAISSSHQLKSGLSYKVLRGVDLSDACYSYEYPDLYCSKLTLTKDGMLDYLLSKDRRHWKGELIESGGVLPGGRRFISDAR